MRKLEKLNIRDIKHLCKHLKCSEKELRKFCQHPEHYYYCQPERIIKNKKRPTATPIGRFSEIIYNLKSLLDRLELPDYLHGGVKGHSPITNASHHIGKAAVLNFDLEDFFPKIRPYLVYTMFNRRLGCSPPVSRVLTHLVTLNGGLPQGSPTSIVVANLVIIPLGERLKGLANKHECDYGQFVDDGAISGPAYIEKLRRLIDRIIRQERFRASPKPHKRKTRYYWEEQVVTGVRVDKRIGVPLDKLYQIQEQIRSLQAHFPNASFEKEYRSVRGRITWVMSLDKKKGRKLMQKLNSTIHTGPQRQQL